MMRFDRHLDSSSPIRYKRKITAYANGIGDRFPCTVPGGGVMDQSKKLFTVRLRGDEEGQECCLDPLGHNRFLGRKGWTPSTDIVETEDTVVILMDLAGLDKEAIKIVREGDLLQISGVRTRKPVPGMKRFHRMEIDYGPFQKLFRVPKDLDVESIEAEHKNGLLEVLLPKKVKEPVEIVIEPEESY
jgi:HSP20 family protein